MAKIDTDKIRANKSLATAKLFIADVRLPKTRAGRLFYNVGPTVVKHRSPKLL